MTEPALDELSALREGAALCRHGQRFLVSATGADVLTWLERLCSKPMLDIAAGDVRRATFMDAKGKLRADLRVLAPGDPAAGLLLELPASHRAALLRLLDMYIIQDDVQLADQSDARELISLLGPRSADVLAALGVAAPDAGRLTTARGDVLVTPSRLGGVPGFDLVGAPAELDALGAELEAAGAGSAGLPALQVVRVAHGVPWFASDLADGVIPLEALLDADVSITKGCYPGQEVVARIQNLGHVARKLARLVAPGTQQLAPGAELLTAAGKSAGSVTSVVHDPSDGRTLALAYIKRAAWPSGSVVHAGDIELTVESLDGD